ncbi:MAG: hypothetical protein J1F67_06755 [Muribaculaceae bacterium]|nr:hypothetical protein [Muribaculaceae bacterium]
MKSLLLKIFLVAISFLLALPLSADLTFRDHRYKSFQTLPPHEKGDIVFIGNSITNMMNWNELFGNSEKIKNRGTSGALTKEILDNLESMIYGDPSKIFVMIGTNDLGTEGSEYQPKAVAYRIKKLLSRIREEKPEAEVYYQSILPTLVGLRNEEKTTQTNAIIKDWIEDLEDPKLTYIDLYSSFVGKNGELKNTTNTFSEDSYSYDGLHLSQNGYKLWADIIKKYIDEDCIIPDSIPNLWGNLNGSQGMRVTHFGAFPISSSDILLIGDEFIHGGEWMELMQDPSFKDRGIGWGFPGINLESMNSIVQTVLKGNADKGIHKEKPKAILIYGGMANLKRGDSIPIIKTKYVDLINQIDSITSGIPIFLMTIVPSDNEEVNEGIKVINKEIKDLVDNRSNVYLIDLFNSFLDQDKNRMENYYSGPNSPYVNGIGYVAAANIIADSLNKVLDEKYSPVSMPKALSNLNNYYKNSEKNNATYIVYDNTNSAIPYRIPAIAKNKFGDLIAVADYRHCKSDIGVIPNGKLDLLYRIQDIKSGEWQEEKTLAGTIDNGTDFIAFGDPCIVADRESDNVLVTSCSGNISFQKGTHENHQGWARFYSEDGGQTWSSYEDISDQVFNLLDKRCDGPINSFFIGSGKIIQSNIVKNGDFYRIYCAGLVRVNDKKTRVNYVFYSDDFGKNWNLLGDVNDCPVPYGADEPKTEELPDGSILISSRISGGRYYNVFHFSDLIKGEGNWDTVAISNEEVGGLKASTNPCNGETLCIPVIRNSDKKETFLLLQSVPLNKEGKRANVGINYKDLGPLQGNYTAANIASNWDGVYEVTPYSSAYSTMILDKDNKIAFFYEENLYNNGFDLILKKLSIDDITNGEFSIKPIK